MGDHSQCKVSFEDVVDNDGGDIFQNRESAVTPVLPRQSRVARYWAGDRVPESIDVYKYKTYNRTMFRNHITRVMP